MRSALRHRDLRLLLGGLLISSTGSWIYNVALLAFVFERTGSLGWVAAAGLARFVPGLLLSVYAGVVAERVERVRLLFASDVLCAVLQAGLVLVVVFDGPVLAALALATLTAVANVVYRPVVAAMTPALAGEEDLSAANALNGTIDNVVVVAGPALGAGLVFVGSPAFAFAVNAVTFAASAVLVAAIRSRSRPSDVTDAGSVGALGQMAVGIRTIASSSAITVLVAFTVLAAFVYGTDTVLLTSVSERRLGTGPDGFGYLLAGLGLGGVLMVGLVNRAAASPRLGAIVTASMIVYCVPTAALAIVGEPVVAFGLEVVRGAGAVFIDVLAITALQRAVVPEVLSRVFGVFEALILGAIAAGALLAPVLVAALGLEGALVAMGLAIPALTLIGYPTLARLDRTAAGRLAELEPRIATLGALRILTGAGRPVLERLAAASEALDVPAGTSIVREGEPSDALYVLLDGRADVESQGEAGGPPRPLRTLQTGSYFGEIGLLERIPRTATVTADGPCRLLRIDGDTFLEALAQAPPAASVLEETRARLAFTHPSRRPTFAASPPPVTSA